MTQLPLRVFQTAASGALAAWLVREAVRAVRSGQARGRYLSFKRAESPMPFWLVIIAQAALAGVCLFVLVRAWTSGP
jgi:hypothetical protein